MESFTHRYEPSSRSLLIMVNTPKLDAGVCPEFFAFLEDCWPPKPANVTLDMAKVEFIDSSGVGALLGVHKRLSPDHGPLVLSGTTDNIRSVIELLCLQRVFRLAEAADSPAGHENRATPQ